MKDSIKPVLKALPAHKIFITFILLLFFFPTDAQNNCDKKTYDIINAIFDSGEARIYQTSLFGKGWANYFEDYDEIFKKVGIPTYISNDELKEIIGEKELRKIRNSIYDLRPCKFSSEHLNDNITLSAEFDNKRALSQGVFRVSMPIIIEENIAVLKKESSSESAIFILQKRNNHWKIIYTFYDWYILED